MKQSTAQSQLLQTKQAAKSKQARPENKDNLDSRKNEEQEFKGDDITHNRRETKTKHLKNKVNSYGY